MTAQSSLAAAASESEVKGECYRGEFFASGALRSAHRGSGMPSWEAELEL